MGASKTVIACTSTWPDSSSMLLTLVKKADTYSMEDLAGPWSVNALATGPGAPWWERGPVNISSDGSFTGRIEDYDGTTYNMSGSTGTFAMSPKGIVTIQRNGEEFRCAMNSGKTVLICTGTWTSGDPGTTEMKVLIKRLPCNYAINTISKSVKAKGGVISIKATASGDYCMDPSLAPVEGWITTAEVTKWAKNKGSIKITVEKQ